jgi:hypothetical protein
MGQYYKPVNLDTMEYLYSHDFDNGLKLMEHSYIGNNFVGAVERLLSPEGPWHRCRLVWAGDYADEGEFLPEGATMNDDDGKPFTPNVYQYAKKNISGFECDDDWNAPYEVRQAKAKKATEKFLSGLPEAGTILVNWTKKVCLDLTKEKNDTDWIIHPLSLLTCSGNGRGGGDYRGDSDVVGTWAGDEISMEHEVPEGIELIDPINIEE